MRKKWIACSLFALGIFLLFIHTTIAALWTLFSLPGPIPLTGTSGILYILPGFSPPLGALLMLLAGLVYGATMKADEK